MVSVAGRQGTRSLSRRLSRERRLSDDEPFIVFSGGRSSWGRFTRGPTTHVHTLTRDGFIMDPNHHHHHLERRLSHLERVHLDAKNAVFSLCFLLLFLTPASTTQRPNASSKISLAVKGPSVSRQTTSTSRNTTMTHSSLAFVTCKRRPSLTILTSSPSRPRPHAPIGTSV